MFKKTFHQRYIILYNSCICLYPEQIPGKLYVYIYAQKLIN